MKYTVDGTDLTSVANAIRTKGGTSAGLSFPTEFVSAIGDIPTGGGSTLITKNITANGTYNALDDDADGYSQVTAAVPGWTFVTSQNYNISTTSTSNETIATLETEITATEANNKIVYVRIRDTAGKRAGYFYASDSYYNQSGAGLAVCKNIVTYSSTSEYVFYGTGGTGGYGVFTTYLSPGGGLVIRARCHATYAPTIDGTYSVEVYTLDYPDGVSPFA